MQRRSVLAVVPVALGGCLDVLDVDPDGREAERLVVEHINDDRAEAGVGQLSVDAALESAAREHSQDMADRGFIGHQNPDGDQPWDRVACDAGETIHSGEIGEMQNVDSHQTWYTHRVEELAGYVGEGWRNSEQHYDILVDSTWQAVGVGIHISDREFFVTAKFC